MFSEDQGVRWERRLVRTRTAPASCKKTERDLNHLLIYHRIEAKIEIDGMARSEVSGMMDQIRTFYGRLTGAGRNGVQDV